MVFCCLSTPRDANNEVLIASPTNILKDRLDLLVYLLSEVTPEQAREYIKEKVGTDVWLVWLKLPDAARALASNPQDLTILAEIVHERGAENVPHQRAELYRHLLGQDNALVNWVRTDSVEIRAIYALAYRMIGEQRILGEQQLGKWVRGALEQELGESADTDTVTAVVDALYRSRFFVQEEKRDILGRRIGFRHELIGKFLASRHMRQRLSSGPEADRDRLFVSSREEVWRDVFQFIIDEIDIRQDLAFLLDHLIQQANPVSLSIAVYAFSEKPATMIPHESRDASLKVRIKLDLEPAALMPA